MSLFPREHGAYGQLLLPLGTSLLLGGASRAGLLMAVAAIAAFLAHEPLLVLLGTRGTRAHREQFRPAVVWLVTTAAIFITAGLAGLASMPDGTRWSVLVPALPASVLAVTTFAGREKSLIGELAAAMAFAGVAVPIATAGGHPSQIAFGVGVVFASIFVSATLAVRGVVLMVRGGGQPAAARVTRIGALAVSLGAAGLILTAALQDTLPWPSVVAAAPGLLAAMWLASFPPPPTALRTVGWTLVITSTAAAIVLVAGL